MAPRGRARRGLGRIDAAIDAMSPLGFPEELVRKTVKNLLKVYGGDDGWVFIEEASYKLLIDAILEQQETTEQEKGSLQDDSCEAARGGNDGETSASGPSSQAPDDPEPSAAGSSSQVPDDPEPSAAGLYTDNAWPSAAGPSTEVPDDAEPSAAMLSNRSPDNALRSATWPSDILHESRSSAAGPAGGLLETPSSEPVAEAELNLRPVGNSLLYSCSDTVHSTQQLNNLPWQRRKHCYGWIGSDEDDFLLVLTPATSTRQLENMIGLRGRQKQRKRRWDMRPEDI